MLNIRQGVLFFQKQRKTEEMREALLFTLKNFPPLESLLGEFLFSLLHSTSEITSLKKKKANLAWLSDEVKLISIFNE